MPTPRTGPVAIDVQLDGLRIWLTIHAGPGERRVHRGELQARDGFISAVPLPSGWGDDLRARLVARLDRGMRHTLAEAPVPVPPARLLELPLTFSEGGTSLLLGSGGDRGSVLLRHHLRLESGRGLSKLLVADVTPTIRPHGVLETPPAAPDGARYWYDLTWEGERISVQPLRSSEDERRYMGAFEMRPTWAADPPVLGLYTHDTVGGWPVTMARFQLTWWRVDGPDLPLVLASAPTSLAPGPAPIWTVTLDRIASSGSFGVLVVVIPPRPTR